MVTHIRPVSCQRALAITASVILVISSVSSLPLCQDLSCILRARDVLLKQEHTIGIGGHITLNEREREVDTDILIPMKQKAIYRRYDQERTDVHDNDLYKFLRKMPKGGDLHIHDISMVDIHWVVKQLTYLPNLYYCETQNKEYFRFKFSDKIPQKAEFCETKWFSVEEKRREVTSKHFDDTLYNKMTTKFDIASTDTTSWNQFMGALSPVGDLVYTEKAFRPYFKQALTELYDDNVLYVEVRTLLLPLTCANGTTFDREETLRQYIEVTEEFIRENVGFIGAKFIFISVRSLPKHVIEEELRLAVRLREKYPDYLLGYDLVGYENYGPPLLDLLDILLIPSQEGLDLPYFFHAGETKKFGEYIDQDILLALLLNTTRIGHGYALAKHPKVMEVVKKREVPIEVCPISNQVLSLVKDIRNHPGVILLGRGFPVVICSDDPSVWRATGLSFDYYAAFLDMTKANDGLGVLKEISQNGIKYSAMTEEEKTSAMDVWRKKWDNFIYLILEGTKSEDAHQEL